MKLAHLLSHIFGFVPMANSIDIEDGPAWQVVYDEDDPILKRSSRPVALVTKATFDGPLVYLSEYEGGQKLWCYVG